MQELPGGTVTLSVNGGPPITGSYGNSPGHGGTGTWSCSGDIMSWHLANSTGSTVLDFARAVLAVEAARGALGDGQSGARGRCGLEPGLDA